MNIAICFFMSLTLISINSYISISSIKYFFHLTFYYLAYNAIFSNIKEFTLFNRKNLNILLVNRVFEDLMRLSFV